MMSGVQEVTPAFSVVKEYLDRKKLAEIGYRFDGESLDPGHAEMLIAVADELTKAEQEVLPKLRSKVKDGRSKN